MSDPASPAGPARGEHPDEGYTPRPAPQYGEYATPEEQRAAIRMPAEPSASVPAAAAAPPAVPERREVARPAARPTTRAARPPRPVDRIITFALLAYGLITVISAVPQLWHFAEFADVWMSMMGIDVTFTNTAQGDLWGRIGSCVYILGWLLTAVLSWRSLRRGRLSWWIPLVGAIVSFVVVAVCLTIPLLGDPAVSGYLLR